VGHRPTQQVWLPCTVPGRLTGVSRWYDRQSGGRWSRVRPIYGQCWGQARLCPGAGDFYFFFLVAVTLAIGSGILTEDGIGLSYRLDGNCFNLLRLQAKSKTVKEYVFELQYADDAALPSHTAAGLQRNLDRICKAYQRAELVVNVKKTEILFQVKQLSTAQPMFTVSSAPLANVQQFTYLGSILISDCDITHEVNRRIQLASTAFGRLSHRVFFNHNLSISTKVAVYNAMCVSFFSFWL